MAEIAHRFVTTNGIKMHVAETGSGPLVLLCHGFPESWYSWRHQLRALGAAGFHAIAPDMRGYGQTDRPKEVEAYDIFQLTGDLVGLINSMGGGPAVIVGHDWGAWITQAAALFRPDLFRAVALLSVPFLPRAPISPSAWEQQKYPGKIFYQQMFRAPGSEQFFDADVRGSIVNALYSASGEPPPDQRWKFAMDPKDMANMMPRRRAKARIRDRRRRRVFRRRIQAERVCRGSQLLPQRRSQLGAHTVPGWCEIGPADAFRRRRSRRRARLLG